VNFLQRIKLNWYDDRETKRLVNEGEYTFSKEPVAILDLGAHKGFATEYFAKKHPNIPIHAYEPNRKLYRVLKRRVARYPKVHCFNEAISDHDGFTRFSINERDVSSSVYGNGTSFLPCVSLQTALNRIGGTASVKSDIEGGEFLYTDLAGVEEMVGEVHPEKAGSTNDVFSDKLRSRFATVVMGEGKCLFRAV